MRVIREAISDYSITHGLVAKQRYGEHQQRVSGPLREGR